MRTLRDRGFSQRSKARKMPAGYAECAKAWRGESKEEGKREADRKTSRNYKSARALSLQVSPNQEASPKNLLEIQTLVSQPRLTEADLPLTSPPHN